MKHMMPMLALTLAACAPSEQGDPHPVDRVDYPVSVTADPSGRLVWVVSGNFDLAYRGAGVLAIDVLENRFVPELAFEVGDFPGPFALLEKDGRAVAGYIASRDDDHLYSVTLSGDDASRPAVTCPDARARTPGAILHCPKSGAIEKTSVEVDGDKVDLTAGADPFSILVRPGRLGGEPDMAFVGGMGDGTLATFALSDDGAPRLVGNLKLAGGLFGLAESSATGRLYASSKLASSFAILDVAPRESVNDPDVLDPVNPYLSQVASVSIPEPALVRDRARALAVSRDGTRLYATYRSPDTLIVLDITDDSSGKARGRVLEKIPMSDDPGDIAVVATATGDELLYVSCFKGDRIEVVDPRAAAIVDSIKVGQGPSDIAVIDRPDLGVQRLYVALFNDHAVGVVELDPASPFHHTEIGEIR